MQGYTFYLYLETALHVSGGTSTHHQERIQLYLQHLIFVTPLLLSGAIVEELEPVRVCCGWRTPWELFDPPLYTRCRIDTIDFPDDGHMAAQNVYRLEINIYEKGIVR
jgi:hypothetical protein